MIGILIIAHGELGNSLIECARHVLGKQPPQLSYLAVHTNDDPLDLLPKARTLVNELDSGDGVIILSDIYGASPCNLVTKLLESGRVAGVAGVNLPMLVRVMTYQKEPLSKVVSKAVSGGRDGVVSFTVSGCNHRES
ncbi:MAG TPA: PTS fructose transporter subunit IIA [Methylophilus sp.]|nr:PTS fructose transporter subunit IIA [Methylophilus sp.]HQQ32786.1 PTS fructose transporter subunit IIA [Methylophilus sp.]